MVKKILEEKPIPLGQVHELLQIREEEGINYVQRVTAQHAEKLSRNAAYSEEVLEMIQSEFGLSRIQAVQIVNINPKTPVDVRAVTEDRLTDDQISKLLENYSKFIAKLSTSTIDTQIDDESEKVEEIEEGFEDL
ncbi:MAG: hypothetical protein ACFE95_07005 [Candidatus Hodarchaeota archaeon]